MTETYQKLSELLARYLPEGQEMVDADTPITSLGLESVQIMEFITEVEDHFDINIDLASLAEVRTLNDLTATVVAQVEQ